MSLTPSFVLRVVTRGCEIPVVLRLAGKVEGELLPDNYETIYEINEIGIQNHQNEND